MPLDSDVETAYTPKVRSESIVRDYYNGDKGAMIDALSHPLIPQTETLEKQIVTLTTAEAKLKPPIAQERVLFEEHHRQDLEYCRKYMKEHPQASENDLYQLITKGGHQEEYKIIGNQIFAHGYDDVSGWMQTECAKIKQAQQEVEKFRNLEIDQDSRSGFFQLKSKTAHESGDIGRIYLNPRIDSNAPLHIADRFMELADWFNQNPDALVDLKMLDYNQVMNDKTEDVLARRDRIVLYFNKDQQDKVVQYIAGYYKNIYEPNVFELDAPLFTDGVPGNLHGKNMPALWGLGMADEPRVVAGERGRSRNRTMAVALDRAFKETARNHKDLEVNLKQQLEHFRIDPNNPASNLPLTEAEKIAAEKAKVVGVTKILKGPPTMVEREELKKQRAA